MQHYKGMLFVLFMFQLLLQVEKVEHVSKKHLSL